MHDADEGESSCSFELAELYKKNFQKNWTVNTTDLN